jgi:hypothetical protein
VSTPASLSTPSMAAVTTAIKNANTAAPGVGGQACRPEPPRQFPFPPAYAAAVALDNVLLGCLGPAPCDGAARLNRNGRERDG